MRDMAKISDRQKFITTEKLLKQGLSHYKINRLVADGTLKKANRSTYENLLYSGDENDFYTASAYAPHGVICLLSAARFHGLTEFLPDSVDVAIERKQKISTLPKWPQLRVYYFPRKRMSLGIEKYNENGNYFRVFSPEKTVVDLLHYRNREGIEECSEVLKNYLKRPHRDLDRLYTYAKELGDDKVLRTYLEVLL